MIRALLSCTSCKAAGKTGDLTLWKITADIPLWFTSVHHLKSCAMEKLCLKTVVIVIYPKKDWQVGPIRVGPSL